MAGSGAGPTLDAEAKAAVPGAPGRPARGARRGEDWHDPERVARLRPNRMRSPTSSARRSGSADATVHRHAI